MRKNLYFIRRVFIHTVASGNPRGFTLNRERRRSIIISSRARRKKALFLWKGGKAMGKGMNSLKAAEQNSMTVQGRQRLVMPVHWYRDLVVADMCFGMQPFKVRQTLDDR